MGEGWEGIEQKASVWVLEMERRLRQGTPVQLQHCLKVPGGEQVKKYEGTNSVTGRKWIPTSHNSPHQLLSRTTDLKAETVLLFCVFCGTEHSTFRRLPKMALEDHFLIRFHSIVSVPWPPQVHGRAKWNKTVYSWSLTFGSLQPHGGERGPGSVSQSGMCGMDCLASLESLEVIHDGKKSLHWVVGSGAKSWQRFWLTLGIWPSTFPGQQRHPGWVPSRRNCRGQTGRASQESLTFGTGNARDMLLLFPPS